MLNIIKQETHNPQTSAAIAREFADFALSQQSRYNKAAKKAWNDYAILCDSASQSEIKDAGDFCVFLEAQYRYWYDQAASLMQYKNDIIAADDAEREYINELPPHEVAYILDSDCTCTTYFTGGELHEIICEKCKLEGSDEIPF